MLSPLSIDERIDPIGPHASVTGNRCSDKGFLAMSVAEYLELPDWTARQMGCSRIVSRVFDRIGFCAICTCVELILQKKGILSQTDQPDFRRFSSQFGTDAMLKNNSRITFFVALVRSLDSTILSALLAVCWRILASLRGFSRRELNPQSF